MSLPKTTDAAAKQILDSTRVYREYARAKREAERYQGSIFWKKVGAYEYLAQKVQGKVTYSGARSPETEREFKEFKQRQDALKQRLRKLKLSVESCQRLNKAVRAGAVPTSVVDVLRRLEEAGLSEASVVLGTPALFAYGQPAGVRLEEVSSPAHGNVVEEAKHHLQVLVHASESAVQAALPSLKDDVDLCVAHAGGGGERTYYLFEFKFHSKHAAQKCIAKDAHWRTVATEMAQSLEHAGKFEQVVIGKTGAMATMRTLDPKFFALVNQTAVKVRSASLPDPELLEWQAALVESLISDDLLIPKLPEAESRRAASKIEELVFKADR
ncbi:GSU2403 family nucleotidyltransferase fold protein [Roseateles chitinivorans]|uniref:GSU2403 family nucleotidyltransferase fold protein n=1 Tax=Roseateles chitinivorans TaxID=2917965 RepID=UPI003D67408B